MFNFNIATEGGNPFVGSGQLDGNGIPADFFSDIHVRKAFNYCFDFEAYIADALAGEAVQVSGFSIPGMLGYDQNGPMYHFDMDKCAEELQQAWDGQVWEKGFRLQIVKHGNVARQTFHKFYRTNCPRLMPVPGGIYRAAVAKLSGRAARTACLYVTVGRKTLHDRTTGRSLSWSARMPAPAVAR
jgi:peptide/nickel transport system substrate-binding protein